VSPVDVQAFYAALEKHGEDKERQWEKSETHWLNWIAGILAIGVAGWITYAALRS